MSKSPTIDGVRTVRVPARLQKNFKTFKMPKMSNEELKFAKWLWAIIYNLRPKNTTGVYITSTGFTYSYRTNSKKFPNNYVSFSKVKEPLHNV